ncbi:MAG: DEAD/DEAH box helicase [Desulfovibrionaceae bacterium]|nr:DEAD/DEAH box helicase [Desulfovibrionaceae bacterium]
MDLAKGFSRWEWKLNSLAQALLPNQANSEKQHRLVWIVDPDSAYVSPLLQVQSAKGKWSSGQKFAIKRLNDRDLNYLTDQDREMFNAYELPYPGYYSNDYTLNRVRAFKTLVDHPLLFLEGSREHIRLEILPVEIAIKEVDNNCDISLGVGLNSNRNVALKLIKEGVYGVYIFERKAQVIRSILGSDGLQLPTNKLPKFLEMIQDVKEVSVNMETTTAQMEGDTLPIVQLWQQGNAFQAAVRVKPSGTANGTAFVPGDGSESVLQIENNKPVIFHRDFYKESTQAQELLTLCPTLTMIDTNWDWYSNSITDFFQLISELKDHTDKCRLEWPAGEKFKLVGKISRAQLSIRTNKSGDWFSLSGEAQINEEKVIELTELLERSTGSSSRFMQLKNGEFLALSDDVKRSLDRINLLSSKRKGNERTVHPLAGPMIDDLMQDLNHESDISWNEMVAKMHKAFELKPEVPANLKAELRPYQKEGYVWLCRLSEWGVGGCLADDMGLGKTIQSIAVMLREAQKGPCLIVAPTSVCPNWEEELHRFAPSLQVVRLKEAEDRKKMVQKMEKGMVLITGYGLLPRERDILAKHKWQMVVFDEAQALKNSATKRSRAASSIQAHFSLALTGTPIENRLEDLWSVFDIINPGLLGNLNEFHRRFSGAESGGSAAQALKMLIRPFILRRLKGQVLDDLPELTEQTIIIEPTEREAAFYESLRRRALEHVDDGPQAKGQKRFNILTELTRLRRACCHASLADPNVGTLVEPVSSKLKRFLELLDEARSGGHRLLVFSQFTGHLALVREELDKLGIKYQYLDGSTPEEKRKENVAAFQRGEGDLFLISLKAGGQGLNLTAADYVVHLDPWWNPAVEDQATDRAHRIGQKNTVTVYRLVMAHTVEEKILKLHSQKRDLAADFLEGHEEAVTQATLSEEELLALLQ